MAGHEQAEPALTAPQYSEDAIALEFVTRYLDRVRYVVGTGWNRWLIHDCVAWKIDESLEIFSLARIVCRDVASTCDDAALARHLSSAATIYAVERLARSDRRVARTVDHAARALRGGGA